VRGGLEIMGSLMVYRRIGGDINTRMRCGIWRKGESRPFLSRWDGGDG